MPASSKFLSFRTVATRRVWANARQQRQFLSTRTQCRPVEQHLASSFNSSLRRAIPTISQRIAIRRASTATITVSSPAATKPRSRVRGFLKHTSLFLVFAAAGFYMAAQPAVEAMNGYLNPPSDAESLTIYTPETPLAAEINTHILTHPFTEYLRSQPQLTESRAHMKIPVAIRANNLTAGSLMGPGMLEVPPLAFNDKENELPSMEQISYLGPALCGHPGLIHGGMLATMLDEGLARTCFPALPHKVGVTASLKIDYRSPCPAGSYVVFSAKTTKVEGRKAWVKGTIQLLGEEGPTGKVLVEAEALFIEPKNVAALPKVYNNQ